MYHFGSGTLVGKPVSGNLAANPTPIQFGALQDVSLDISFDLKELYGQSQFPLAVARGKAKITGKAKFAAVQAKIMNDLFWGQTVATGQSLVDLNHAKAIPTTPFQITAGASETGTIMLIPNSGTFSQDMGVVYASTNLPLTRVASAPAQGQYSVTEPGGAYTFAAADTGVSVMITYLYTVTSGFSTSLSNQLMGYQPEFQIILNEVYNGKQHNVLLYRCVANKLTHNTKNEDFLVPELDFMAFSNSAGQVMAAYDNE